MTMALLVLGLICAAGLTARFPVAATVLWILVLETSPDNWLNGVADYETIVGAMKATGLVLVLVLGVRFGVKSDRYNPGFAFGAMFCAGVIHGLYPGLGLGSSLRSLVGSAAPFAFGFIRPPDIWTRAVVQAVMFGPLFTMAFGLALSLAGAGHMYDFEQGAMRLGASGEPAFLAGYALTAIYAGLMEWLRAGRRADLLLLAVNFVILVLTGARAPLLIALVLMGVVLLAQGRVVAAAAAGAVLCGVLVFAGSLNFIRVVDLAQLGEVADLSNRDLVWPHFAAAIAGSPWVGWGVGAGKVVVPLGSQLHELIGTNAAHDEYLRIGAEGGFLGLALLLALLVLWVARGSRGLPPAQRWLMRLVMLGFALQSATDNTLIATTSSVLFIWVSAIFATAALQAREAA